MKKGLLLINLGTPDAPNQRAVRRYLREFLADKRVIALPAPLRFLLLYFVILPFRTQSTTHAYQSIWSSSGSPLLKHSLNLLKKVQARVQDHYQVALGMRYGSPSIETALTQLRDCSDITVLPLYPQYSSAATGSSIEKVFQLLSRQPSFPHLNIIRDFHDYPAFIRAKSAMIEPYVAHHDYILLSYHGLPEQHLINEGCASICSSPCESVQSNSSCYRAQCFQTTRLLASVLNLKPEQYGTAFQSRLGRTPWIQPYTTDMLHTLAQQGIKRLAIACPSFVADCLETLEEIGIRARQQWLELGGETLTLIPCLNDDTQWVETIIQLAYRL